MSRAVAVLLGVVLVCSAALHARQAANPTTDYQSADEKSYGHLAIGLAEHLRYGDGGQGGLHWPPGAPVLFAVAQRIAPGATDAKAVSIGAAYWLQALVSLGTAVAACVLAWALAGRWAGVLAAALVGLYPPLIMFTGEQLSEPLGAFLVTAALAALALRHRSRFALPAAGALFGLAVLTRADLILAPIVVGLLAGAWIAFRRKRPRHGVRFAVIFLGAAGLVVFPWVIYASTRADRFIPVTSGSSVALFVGTYLPGDGTTFGMKRALGAETKRTHPKLRDKTDLQLSSRAVFDVIAARHPELPRDEAIQREARRNLTRYGLGQPFAFAGMMGSKAVRMWSRYARGGARHTSTPLRVYHVVLVVGSLAGLLAGLWRRREPLLAIVLAVVLYSTALHALVVSQGRYNLPLIPALIAAGVAGWFLAPRPRARAAGDEPATLQEWNSDRSASGAAAAPAPSN
ncbi:MAG TPA: hypothetical protein VFG79_21660 [Solirubrobacter sp.]|nr:hypothetical protein [Solirubrobacter sp.]